MKIKNIKNDLKNIGSIKTIINRTRADLGYGTFLMMLYLCIERGIDWYWFLSIPAYMIFKLKDINKYHGQEANYNWEKCDYTMELTHKVREIHEMTENIYDEIVEKDLPELFKRKNKR